MKVGSLSTLIILSFICSAFTEDDYWEKLFTYGGFPELKQSQEGYKVLVNTAYAVGYSETLKNPLWAAYRAGNLKGKQNSPTRWERPARFLVDTRTDARVEHDDYISSYERGHMVPDAMMGYQYGQIAQYETYLLSNICPQTRLLNRGIWMQLEGEIRDKLSQDDTEDKEVHDVWVITGPIFQSNPIPTLASGIPIPDSFYKIIAYRRGYNGTVKAVSFVIPQEPSTDDIFDYLSSVDQIEALTGIDFFPELSTVKQDNLESVKRDFLLETID